jgi:hypothetical protein
MTRFVTVGILLASVLVLAGCKVSDTGSAPQDQGQGGAAQATQEVAAVAQGGQNGTPGPGPTFDPTTAAAFQQLNRLEVGMLYLQDTSSPLTKDQATQLLPLWQDVETAMRPPQNPNGTPGANQTPGADQNQTPGPGQGQRRGGFFFANAGKIETDVSSIQALLTQEQMSAINSLTQDQMTSTLQKHGISVGSFGGQGGFGGPGGFGGQGGFGGTPGAFETARAEGTQQTRPTPDANQLATRQAQRSSGQGFQGDPLIAEVIKTLQALAGG